MRLLILGRGKTGSLVAEVARHRGHQVEILCAAENPGGSALTAARLAHTDCVIDFTNPSAVTPNIEACIREHKNMVVGTTSWYSEIDRIRELALQAGIGFVYATNFSIGMNLFFDVVRTAAAAMRHRYNGQIFERHHAHKKDAPSGTAVTIQRIVKESSDTELEIISFREGEVVGMHELIFDSAADSIYLCHDAKSRRGFAEGAVYAAQWLEGKKGFFDFKKIWREL